jgi:hypothetical protein
MSPLEKLAVIAATARYEPDPRKGLAELAAAVIDLVNEGPHGAEPQAEETAKAEG